MSGGEPVIGQDGWNLVEIFLRPGATAGTTIHHERTPHPKADTEMRPGTPEELSRPKLTTCGNCLRRLQAGTGVNRKAPPPKTGRASLKARPDDPRDMAERLQDAATLDKWLRDRQQERRYRRQVQAANERGEVAEGE